MAGTRTVFMLYIQGPEGFSKELEVLIGITTIGREAANTLQLEHRQVSRFHARLDTIASECEITDLDSSNGTFVNGEKLTARVPQLLRHNDQLKIGIFELRFEQIEVPVEEQQVEAEVRAAAPPEEPPPPPPPAIPEPAPQDYSPPPGLSIYSQRLINYLPAIYQTDFMARFLGIFEAILLPLEWNIDNFDLFLSPKTSPSSFLPWLASWGEVGFDATWSEAQRRAYLTDAYEIYARHGTKWALSRVLEIYTGVKPEIDDLADGIDPHVFRVTVPILEENIQRASVEAIINAHKPAHTVYELHFQA